MRKMLKKIIAEKVAQLVKPYLYDKDISQATPESLISKAARFVACEMIEGDYLEFGVYQGASFINAYHTLNYQFRDRIALDVGGEDQEVSRARRTRIIENMKFIAFDSFNGLPALKAEDLKGNDFTQGMYACSLEQFVTNTEKADLDSSKVKIVKGWFEDTCLPKVADDLGLTKASIIWIDADLYSSTKTVLKFVSNFIQDGTIIIFDDWFSNKGSPYLGEQKAFYEWIEEPFLKQNFLLHEYQRETWKRMSFIVSKKSA